MQTRINKDVQAHLDSLVRSQAAAQLDRASEAAGESVTEIIVFDTDKPADSTGLPPVRAVLRKQTKQAQRREEKAAVQAEEKVQVAQETTDRGTEVNRTGQVEEKKPATGAGILRTGIGALLLAVSILTIRIFYKRIKR